MEESFEELVEEYLCAQESWISLRRRKDKQEPLGEISAGQRAAIEHGARWKMIKERAEDKHKGEDCRKNYCFQGNG